MPVIAEHSEGSFDAWAADRRTIRALENEPDLAASNATDGRRWYTGGEHGFRQFTMDELRRTQGFPDYWSMADRARRVWPS